MLCYHRRAVFAAGIEGFGMLAFTHVRMGWIAIRWVLLALAAALPACSSNRLMPRPNLYADPSRNPFQSIPESRRSSFVPVIYGTDRLREPDARSGRNRYGHGRSLRLAVGECRVGFGGSIGWEELVKESLAERTALRLAVDLTSVVERAAFAAVPHAINWVEKPGYTPFDIDAEDAAARDALHKLVADYAAEGRREAVVFIHGYNYTFEDAVLVSAQLWHYLGRSFIPVTYTWPAGRGGLTGYTTDSESGDFTLYHLKQFLQALNDSPDIDRIHIIAHSRGTEVAMDALREMAIRIRAEGDDLEGRMKFGQVILASPDIDSQVFGQRFIAEGMFNIADRFTIYLSPNDRALFLSRWLHGGLSRLGLFTPEELGVKGDVIMRSFRNVDFVKAAVKTDFIGHSFFYTDPAVSSDLILLLTEKRRPGLDYGRPLRELAPNFWQVDPNYPWDEKGLIEGIFEFGLSPLKLLPLGG